MQRNIKSLSAMAIFLLALTGSDNSDGSIASPVEPVKPVVPPETEKPVADRSGIWPASAINDPELAGKEPVMPEVYQTLSAELNQNAKGLLDEAIDADVNNSQPDTLRIQAAIDACNTGAVKLVAGATKRMRS